MAEESEEKTEEQGKGGASVLTIALVGVVALLAGAGATYFLVGGAAEPGTVGEAEGEAADSTQEAEVPFSERLVSLDPFVVNVSSNPYPRYVKVKMELEVDEPEQKQRIEDRMAQVRDSLIVLITSKRLDDVSDFEGKALLKEEIVDRLNGLAPEPLVRSVLFTEFVIQ